MPPPAFGLPVSTAQLGRWSAAKIARVYFGAQALAGLLWWVSVFLVPEVRDLTLGALNPVLVATFDVPLFVIASALAAFGVKPAARVAVIWTVGVGVGLGIYATISGLAGLGALLMVIAAACSVAAGALLLLGRIPTEWVLFGPFAFQTAKPTKRLGFVGRTGSQLVIFWGTFLFAIPVIVAFIEKRWQLNFKLAPAATQAVQVTGIVLLVAASALGIWSAISMSKLGQGTPLPSAMAQNLVIRGPYRYVRNPMAVSGIWQGAAVGLILGSWLVVAYALIGSLFWNWVIRPLEEDDLEGRFGEEFTRYRDQVSCWFPRRTTLLRGP